MKNTKTFKHLSKKGNCECRMLSRAALNKTTERGVRFTVKTGELMF